MKNGQIRSIDDMQYASEACSKVLTLFSGGLDSSYVLHRLQALDCQVIALLVDVGDGADRSGLLKITHTLGARLQIVDCCEEFANSAVLQAIRSQAKYLGQYPISSSLSRPIIAKAAVEIARQNQCGAIIHTANQSQNSLRRLNGAIKDLGYEGYFGSPYEFDAISRAAKQEKLVSLGLHEFEHRHVSGDANLWCREFESGVLDNPEYFSVPDSAYLWTDTRSRLFRQTDVSQICISFESGEPVSIDGIEMNPVSLIAELNNRGGQYGIGRYEGLEYLEGGSKVLEVREAPAAALLMEAYRHLEMSILPAELLREKHAMEQLWVREAIDGRWFGDVKRSVDAFIDEASCKVTGEVRFALMPGQARLLGVVARNASYLIDRDQWEENTAQQSAARSLRELAKMQIPLSSVNEAVVRSNVASCKFDVEQVA
ncbi:MAG: argininosuccinate synthase-related protein [Granulosicoccus sp.]